MLLVFLVLLGVLGDLFYLNGLLLLLLLKLHDVLVQTAQLGLHLHVLAEDLLVLLPLPFEHLGEVPHLLERLLELLTVLHQSLFQVKVLLQQDLLLLLKVPFHAFYDLLLIVD
mmetsp:Transcript_30363/g.29720  ORF Transcript_30363/g.29720 Transcript_30363/m.29720 type:complete len:113 (-) Transcript_30363:2337-2675(-)